jgi:hypothetical protein
MSFGFIALHPVTLPLGNELTNAMLSLLKYMDLVYGSIIKPELAELIETLRLCL